MSTWTKIPETKIASTLGQAAGKLAGNVSATAGKALDTVNQKIQDLEREVSRVRSIAQQAISDVAGKATDLAQQAISDVAGKATDLVQQAASDGTGEVNNLAQQAISDVAGKATGLAQQAISGVVGKATDLAQQKVLEFIQKAASVLSPLVITLDAVSNSLTPVTRIASTLRIVPQTLRSIISPLQGIIAIIKSLPLPQRYLTVSFTVLESDLLEMMEQLIKQAEEAIGAIEGVLDLLENVLKPIQDRIEAIRARLALLTVSCNLLRASEEDIEVLDRAGLIDRDSGDSLFEKIQTGLQGGGSTVGYGVSPDLTNPELANKLYLAKAGDVVSITKNPSGSYVELWFCYSEEQPSLPAGFPQITGSWTQEPFYDPDNLWKVELKVTGNGNIFGGLDSVPEPATEEDLEYSKQDFGTEEYLVLDENNYERKPGILKVDDWTGLLEDTLNKLRNLPLSQDLKDVLDSAWNKEVVGAKAGDEDVIPRNLKFQWTSKVGETFNIEIVEDEHLPRVAVRRYARVTDQGGTVVLDGFKTFSTNIDSLLQEIKIQLEQLIR